MKIQKLNARKYSYGGERALFTVKAIVIHYTGCDKDTAQNEARYFAYSNTRSAGAHFFVDQSGEVWQSIPMNKIAWSVGGVYSTKNGAGTYYKQITNANSVSIELCDIAKRDPSPAQIKATRELVAYIQKQCPNAKRIVRHWDVNGKLCPSRMAGVDNPKWQAFLSEITGGTVTKPKAKTKTTTANLNLRTGASTKYRVLVTIPKHTTITILESGKSWSKVKYKNKVGWCSNAYLK